MVEGLAECRLRPDRRLHGNDFRAAYRSDSLLNGSGQIVGLLQFDGTPPVTSPITKVWPGCRDHPAKCAADGFSGIPTHNGGEVESFPRHRDGDFDGDEFVCRDCLRSRTAWQLARHLNRMGHGQSGQTIELFMVYPRRRRRRGCRQIWQQMAGRVSRSSTPRAMTMPGPV